MSLLLNVLVFFPSLMKTLMRGTVAILLTGAFLTVNSAWAATDTCPLGILGPGTGQDDLKISAPCHVGDGTYKYGNVNIIGPAGSLIFDEKIDKVKIDFWAKSILVENKGSLIAGSLFAGLAPSGSSGGVPSGGPFGSRGGVLTIHLYGANQGIHGAGITCKSQDSTSDFPPCGIDTKAWNSNGNGKVPLPGGAPDDYFYQYDSLPFDDGVTDNKLGYFGYKVLAVSYGGTLQLFGKKGAVYGNLLPQDSGRSWIRLKGTILGKKKGPLAVEGATSLTVDNPVNNPIDWEVGDHIVVTTTDYIPSHSEELVICSIAGGTIGFTADINATPKPGQPATCPVKGVQWTHYGKQFSLGRIPPSRKITTKAAAETRAAVGLLTHSIRIVSEGKAISQPLPPAPCSTEPCTDYYFGGHTIARQGFKVFQVQGVEFRQLGQGGRLGHYPVHFHMARRVPPGTYIKDSSVNESMTRWFTVHATQGVTLARNVGYLSIGHGFYLEDAVETDNKFHSNLGIFARAAVLNDQNPRKVPGILASPDDTPGSVKYGSDKATPAVFWITHGWNDFQGNMAAGAGMCGVCYWEIPASISGPSKGRNWESYASGQAPGQVPDRTGSSPLKNFDGNYCTSAMSSFQSVGYTAGCFGVGPPFPDVSPVTNPLAPASTATSPACGTPTSKWPFCPGDYYPNVDNGELGQATKCPDTGVCNEASAPLCQYTNESQCMPTIINNYTTSFHWAPYNFSAVWLRRRWHLVANSFISDVQNAGLTFVGGGDYTHSSAIPGLWNLAFKTVFAGQTQPDNLDHAFASVLSPFNKNTGLTCENASNFWQLYCISKNNSISMGPFSAFGVSQHIFNIYDGPAYEDSNAFLDIKKKDLGTDPGATGSKFLYSRLQGVPKSLTLDPQTPNPIPVGNYYMPNAAIAWKQPNGFYYPPNFRSQNMFFDGVDIRHYVIVPQFDGDTYATNTSEVTKRYWTKDLALTFFNNFTAIDRQTELTDNDGSLTGYAHTSSVNEDKFFKGPIEGPECQSDGSVPKEEGGTAKTSPYDHVTTVVYPEAAQFANSTGPLKWCRMGSVDPNWDSNCSTPNCVGVPFYRLYQTGKEHTAATAPPFIRMAGFDICQRQTMSANHGRYLVDVTLSSAKQSAWPASGEPAPWRNVFIGGQTYDFFHVYGTKDTEQTFVMYVGPGFDPAKDVKPIRVDLTTSPLKIKPGTGTPLVSCVGGNSTIVTCYKDNMLTVTLNQSAFASDYMAARQEHCVPKSFCTWNGTACVGTGTFSSLSTEDRNATCKHAGEDVDCPKGGCVGFSVKLPAGFVASDQTTTLNLPKSLATCFPKDANWNKPPKPADPPSLAGACVNSPMKTDFCQ